jgi:hypothetical protein
MFDAAQQGQGNVLLNLSTSHVTVWPVRREENQPALPERPAAHGRCGAAGEQFGNQGLDAFLETKHVSINLE